MVRGRMRACVRSGVLLLLTAVCVLGPTGVTLAHAQAIDDGVMLADGQLVVGSVYSHDSWKEYWEGALKRENGNIGTLTTQTNAWFANYGLTDRLTILGTVPHVWTTASQGVLHSMHGFQDLNVAAKYRLFDRATRVGAVRAIAVAAGALPLTDYTPDFFPLSLGFGSKRLSGRGTLSLQPAPGWSVTGSTSYTWRSGVTLDRPFYFTDGQMFFTDQVDLANVFDYIVSVGVAKRKIQTAFAFVQQRTLGGGDIRRQDMPFVSNRMNSSRLGGMVGVPVPTLEALSVQFQYGYTVAGRNVGQSSTFTAGLAYRLPFGKAAVQ
jgi:outer membrane putative beta-barrel porin/alpha-amylase